MNDLTKSVLVSIFLFILVMVGQYFSNLGWQNAMPKYDYCVSYTNGQMEIQRADLTMWCYNFSSQQFFCSSQISNNQSKMRFVDINNHSNIWSEWDCSRFVPSIYIKNDYSRYVDSAVENATKL